MLLATPALPLMAVAGLGLHARAGVLLGLIAVYVPVAGAGPSLQRAALMGAAAVVAGLAARPASRAYALLAAAVTLTVNPRAVGDVGWQLSFAALVGILLVGPQLRRVLMPPLEGLPAGRALADGAALTLAPRWPRRRCSPTTSGRSRWPLCRPTCSRCPPWRR